MCSGPLQALTWEGPAEAGTLCECLPRLALLFEHHAVLHTLQALEKEGFEVTLLDVHANGVVTAEEVKNAIREDTALVTIM